MCLFKNVTNDFSSEFSQRLRGLVKLTSALLWWDVELHSTQYKTELFLTITFSFVLMDTKI